MSDTNETFEAALTRFVTTVQQKLEEYYTSTYEHVKAPKISIMVGARFVRIVKDEVSGAGRSVYCFVEIGTGNVLKADGWKRPAKGVRGSIFAKDWNGYGVGVVGANYAR